ncbi:hypothetical protein NM208_g5852 [Fusarium decemcellulare]|uniref:Uncharacterized protein n=1 Tax=Fusarium decemcellulare TaxID=57161 RepID=A0ACC1SFL0_9HYPO|nr:hypothetical protein NM208_g5852 [Fusarium decemcellulare]
MFRTRRRQDDGASRSEQHGVIASRTLQGNRFCRPILSGGRDQVARATTGAVAGLYGAVDHTLIAKQNGVTGRQVLEVQEVYAIDQLPEDAEEKRYEAQFSNMGEGQVGLVIFCDVLYFIKPSWVEERFNAYLDYNFNPTERPFPEINHNFIVGYFYSRLTGRYRSTAATTPL